MPSLCLWLIKNGKGKSCLFNNAGCMGVKVFQKLGPKEGNNRQAIEKCRQCAAVVKSVGVWDVNNLGFKSQCSHFQEECCERLYCPGLCSFPVSFFFFFLIYIFLDTLCDMRFLTGDQTWVRLSPPLPPTPAVEAQSLNHWTAREVPPVSS